MRIRLFVPLLVLALVGSVLGHASGADAAREPRTLKRFTGVVGPGYKITLAKPSGTIRAGRYTFVISDRSSMHDFHLRGPGVDKRTSVSSTGSVTWTVTLRTGTYTYQCDPHLLTMQGRFKVS